MKVYFIQCDCLIQDVALIRNREDWLAYEKKIRIRGRGGTDFTPVFDYVEKQRQRKELKDLKALLYFTDGMGIYPAKRPPYDVAFVLLEEPPLSVKMPPWAIRLVLETPELEKAAREAAQDLPDEIDWEELPRT